MLTVTTGGGAENGKAICKYQQYSGHFIEFINTNNNQHTQPLVDMLLGDYQIMIVCEDIAGNFAEQQIQFSVDVDTQGPRIVNIFRSGNNLQLITDEPSTCEYSLNQYFVYGQGEKMSGENVKEHNLAIASNKYYIECQDQFNNRNRFRVLP